MTKAAAGVLMLILPFSILAQQPATVGELIDKGGKKLGSEEVTKLISGSDVSGVLMSSGHQFEVTYKSNGTLQGRLIGARTDGRSLAYWGKWSVNERGELCVDINSSGGPSKGCQPFFQSAGKYYQASKDDKSAPIYLREIKR